MNALEQAFQIRSKILRTLAAQQTVAGDNENLVAHAFLICSVSMLREQWRRNCPELTNDRLDELSARMLSGFNEIIQQTAIDAGVPTIGVSPADGRVVSGVQHGPMMGARCPYCGHNGWNNSWGQGDAACGKCGREFNVFFEDGKMLTRRIGE